MSPLKLYSPFFISIFLAACGGNSSSSDSDDNAPNLGSGNDAVICPSGSTFEIEGIELTTQVYDTNKDGCLSGFEYSRAVLTAQRILEQREKELQVDGVNAKASISQMHNMKVTGSSEVSNDKIQLHTNIESGKFYVSLRTYSTGSSTETLKFYFDDESAEGKASTVPPFAISALLPPMVGELSYVLGCRYQSDVTVHCDTLAVTETDNIGASVRTAPIDITFSLNLTFSEQSLPQPGYIIATFCDGLGGTMTCLNNYAQVPVSFN